MVENNPKEWRRGMKERKWKNNSMEEKERELEAVKRRDGDKCGSVTGTLWHPWTDTACLKAVLTLKRSSVSSCLQNIFIYFSIRSFILLFISIGGTLGKACDNNNYSPPSHALLIPRLKKIKPLSNKLMYSLIQSSHHHRVLASSTLVTTAGLLSLAAMATALLVASMIYHKKERKKEGEKEKKGLSIESLAPLIDKV